MSLSTLYGEQLAKLQREDPEAARIIREYVARLRTEAAGYRREAHRLRSKVGSVNR